MKTHPIVPIEHAPGASARSALRLAQARDVCLAGNRLPLRWQGRSRFVVLETGFGFGHAFLATWQAWRDDPARCGRLDFLAIEARPPTAAALREAHAQSPAAPLAAQLQAQWPPLTHNLHALDLDGGRVRLLLALGDLQAWLPELIASVDAFVLDGPPGGPDAAGRSMPSADPRVFKALARLAAPGATAASKSVAPELLDGLRSAGFAVQQAPAAAGAPPMTVAEHAPRFAPKRPPARAPAPDGGERRALIVGAGLAGAWTAHALAAEGWACTVFDRQPAPAMETSGNPAGLFHGVVTPEDGAHARFYRSCAMHLAREVPRWLAAGVPGCIDGLLRLSDDTPAQMLAWTARHGLPPDYVRTLDRVEATRLAGLPVARAAWHYPQGGWLAPSALVAALVDDLLQRAPGTHQARFGVAVGSLQRSAQGWRLLDADGAVLDEAPVVVLANAADALPLLGAADGPLPGPPGWTLFRSRGQVTRVRAAGPTPRLPLAGAGYVIPLGAGELLCGATNDLDDPFGEPREADDQRNLAQLASLLGQPPLEPRAVIGHRVGWRLSPHDRLPLLGAVPAPQGDGLRQDQPRFVLRQNGLYVFTALGSRGITTAPLAARALAAWISGSPVPLEASLLDAIDVARFRSRVARRTTPR